MLQVVVVQALVNKANVAIAFGVVQAFLHLPVIFGQGFGKANVKTEVGKLFFYLTEVVNIEELAYQYDTLRLVFSVWNK